jgi:regulatory protein
MIGKITEIKTQVKSKTRVSIFIDGAYRFSAHMDVMVNHGLHVGMEISEELLEEIQTEDELKKAYAKGIDIVSRRPHTEKEIRDKLKDKEYAPVTIDKTIEKLREYGYVDDEAFLEHYLSFKGHVQGPRKIKYDLIKKGIAEHLIDNALEALKDDEYSQCFNMASNKLNSMSDSLEMSKKYNRLAGFLQRKGYGFGVIKEVLRDLELRPYD